MAGLAPSLELRSGIPVRSRLHKLRLLVSVLRLTAAVLLVAIVGGMPAGVAATYAELCCDDCDDGDESGECDDEHDHDCDCPLGCSSCCVGSTARAIVGGSAQSLGSPLLEALRQAPVASERPPDGVARDILKVPKPAA